VSITVELQVFLYLQKKRKNGERERENARKNRENARKGRKKKRIWKKRDDVEIGVSRFFKKDSMLKPF
jgi:hypothetical protein